MEYLIICAFQFLGVGFHAGQKIAALDKQFPTIKNWDIVKTFVDQDWNTLLISVLVLALNLLVHFCLQHYAADVFKIQFSFTVFNVLITLPIILFWYVISFGAGYMGQRIIYKGLGTTEKFLGDKLDK